MTTATRSRRRTPVENEPYRRFVGRILAAYGRRIGAGDIAALPELVGLRDDIDAALLDAVQQLRNEPHKFTWQRIADELGVSRQAVMDRWASKVTGGRRPGGQPANLR